MPLRGCLGSLMGSVSLMKTPDLQTQLRGYSICIVSAPLLPFSCPGIQELLCTRLKLESYM